MCTGIRFVDKSGNMYFGRNLDWSCSYGERVVITPTGYAPSSPFGAITRIEHPVIGMGIVQENVSRLFHTLAGVAMIDGAARMTDGEFELTIFTGGVSCRTNTYYYSTYDDPAIRSVALGDYDMTASDLVVV